MSSQARRLAVVGLAMSSLGACGPVRAAGEESREGVDGGAASSAEACEPPDMVILVDRSQSMSSTPDGRKPPNTREGRMTSKWWIAIDTTEALTAALDGTIRFGLSLFPRDPGGGACVTLEEELTGADANNRMCEAGEMLVDPVPLVSGDIAAALDPDTSVLCRSTPIGAGLGTAGNALVAIQDPIRSQYILFIGDGKDTCDGDLVIRNTQAIATHGIHTFVVSFDGAGGVDNAELNHMACAGRTAIGFPGSCTDDGSGNYTAADPDGSPLYLRAETGTQLAAALADVAGRVCCNCVD